MTFSHSGFQPHSGAPAFRIAFQPIVDVRCHQIFAHEALARGAQGESAATLFGSVPADTLGLLDQQLRVAAMSLSRRLGLRSMLSLNLFAQSDGCPSLAMRRTLAAADALAFPYEQLMFEITEWKAVLSPKRLRDFIAMYRDFGFKTALDDFGRGYCNVELLSEFRPDIIKLDDEFTRVAPHDARGRTIIRNLVSTARHLGCDVVAEGVETAQQSEILNDLGIPLQQGYLFARPAMEILPSVAWPGHAGPPRHSASIRWSVAS